MKLIAIGITSFALGWLLSPPALATTCEEAKKVELQPNASEKKSAAALYALHRKNQAPYRPQKDIEATLVQIRHIKMISETCDIPIKDIDANKYFELTGKLFVR